MHFGGPLPWHGPLASRENLLLFATTCESLGFEWVTGGEHLLYPKELQTPHPRTGTLPLDPSEPGHELFTLFAWLAGATDTLRFMTSMTIVPYRSPYVLAKLVSGLDFVSNGRFILGAAVGWMREEFEALDIDFHRRGRITDDALDVVRRLLTNDEGHRNEHFSYPPVWFEPKPVVSPFPIVVGGLPVATVMRRVARFGTGWWPWPLSAEQIAAAMPAMRHEWESGGRGDEPLEIHAHGRVLVDAARGRLDTRQDVVGQIETLAAAGVTHLTMTFNECGGPQLPVSVEPILEAMHWFASEVMPEAAHF